MSLTVKAGKYASSSMPGVGSVRPTVGRMGQQGDPGIFGDIGRFIGGTVAPMIPVVGPLIGAGITGLSNALDPQRPKTIAQTAPILVQDRGFGMPQGYPQLPQRTPGIGGAAQRFFPGGATGYEGGGPPKGYRLNKSGYFLKSGEYVAPGTKYVKIRRRNPLNPKALDRAISRIESGKKASKRLGRVTVRKPQSCR